MVKKLDKPYKWQVPTMIEVREALKVHREVVLAACPSAGKTTMSMNLAAEDMATGGLVVVLAHGTNVLKNQWTAKCDEWGIPHGEGTNLIIVIPQMSRKKLLKLINGRKVSFLIIDEAHEFYHAKMVQDILKALNPERVLLLTGTPSRFVLDNQLKKADRPIIILSGVEAYQYGQLQNTYMALVKSSYSFASEDTQEEYDDDSEEEDDPYEDVEEYGAYNTQGDLKQSVVLHATETEASLEDVVKEMIQRLTLPVGGTNANVANTRLLTWASVFGKLKKTMIAAHSIKQAHDIGDALKKHDVNYVISESESDADNLNIAKFKNVVGIAQEGVL